MNINIERDKLTIIPYIHTAQRYNPQMTFWVSPWSPPAWMKINHHYAVQSSPYNDLDKCRDYLLFRDYDRSVNEQVNPDKRLFPRRLAVQDFFIQDSRYLQCYANQFCLFIDLYKQQGVDINMVMYQSEAPRRPSPLTTLQALFAVQIQGEKVIFRLKLSCNSEIIRNFEPKSRANESSTKPLA